MDAALIKMNIIKERFAKGLAFSIKLVIDAIIQNDTHYSLYRFPYRLPTSKLLFLCHLFLLPKKRKSCFLYHSLHFCKGIINKAIFDL